MASIYNAYQWIVFKTPLRCPTGAFNVSQKQPIPAQRRAFHPTAAIDSDTIRESATLPKASTFYTALNWTGLSHVWSRQSQSHTNAALFGNNWQIRRQLWFIIRQMHEADMLSACPRYLMTEMQAIACGWRVSVSEIVFLCCCSQHSATTIRIEQNVVIGKDKIIVARHGARLYPCFITQTFSQRNIKSATFLEVVISRGSLLTVIQYPKAILHKPFFLFPHVTTPV